MKTSRIPESGKLIAGRILPAQEEEIKGKMHYYAVCNVGGTESTYECTHHIYRRIEDNKLNSEHRSQFSLSFNEDNLVDAIGVEPKEGHYNPRGGEIIEDSTGEASVSGLGVLIISRPGNKEVNVRNKPQGVSNDMVNDIKEHLYKTYSKKVKKGDILLDKYLVLDVRDAGTNIHIQPTIV